ncbi:isocitrate lyase/PEP mutase family protein [Actinoplanes utahensis]|uniref:2-methylisocitrate lyase n=1 Tax=Actinoplanes utahensis TaxID=1869 RepID=A0A0A6USS7_ACTUT|nr:isocitrate lyase/phosphoenolpyruvate mutase family protein [Actinoplanes utahensis]KHD78043.1 2-methylisocitrate lyase [Actinoplanes utahensis]GIF30056.1 2-methylisocitrate lyase [Actinoplanes utahensis]
MSQRFHDLHAAGTFVIPNAWDAGSARLLETAGFPAVATTSSGLAAALGKLDQQVTRDELVTQVAAMARAITVPLSVDSERLFDDPAETVELLAEAGAAGVSIEDYDPATGSVEPLAAAVERVGVAAEAARRHGLVLTARAEGLLYGQGDRDDVITRLVAYRDAGAGVLFAPGLQDDIAGFVTAVRAPVNVLLLPGVPSVPELARAGVRRVSVGGSLAWAAYGALRDAARELLDTGTAGYRARGLTPAEVTAAFGG